MAGKTVGYIRVSSFDQNPDRQLENYKLDKQFIDKASGKDTNRPALEELLIPKPILNKTYKFKAESAQRIKIVYKQYRGFWL